MRYPDFGQLAVESRIDTRLVQEFLDSFENDDWSDIEEGDREDIERARKLKELVTAQQVSDQTFEKGMCVLVRENAFTDYIKDREQELNEDAWKAMPRVWCDHIDWEGVVQEFRSDYAEITWEDDTYLFEVND